MNQKIKKELTNLSKSDLFKNVFKKLIVGNEISYEEKSFILSCAVIFLKHYQKDNRFRTYLEFGYYIILKYSLRFKDFRPLYDLSVNLGFFPTVDFIHKKKLLPDIENWEESLIESKLKKFKDRSRKYTQTLEQYNRKTNFITDKSKQKSFIAPTSFGKSSAIIDYIEKNDELDKIAIIVPTKSLLSQTGLTPCFRTLS